MMTDGYRFSTGCGQVYHSASFDRKAIKVVACSGRERLKPAVDQAAGQVQPMTENFTRDVLRPGGEKISENAVPVTKHIAEKQVQPVVDQVITNGLQRLSPLFMLF